MPPPSHPANQKHSEVSQSLPCDKQDSMNIDEIVSVGNTEESKPTKRKKKKKKNTNLADAETNTTQQLEPLERRPPPRLEPLHNRDVTVAQTPPLRSKYPRHASDDSYNAAALPPAGNSPVKHNKKIKHSEIDPMESKNLPILWLLIMKLKEKF